MRLIVLAIYLLCLPLVGADEKEPPEPVRVYCFSADLEAGFKDDPGEYWCKELGKIGQKKGSLEVADVRETADIIVEYLGTEEIKGRGEATYLLGGYAWTPDQTQFGARAIVSVGNFKKGFFCQGSGARGVSGVRRMVESWIRENRDTILKKASEKQ